jgi:ribosomal protein L37AE/L43A
MAGVMYFIQECPTCGRRLQVRVIYLGKRVACHHCGAQVAAGCYSFTEPRVKPEIRYLLSARNTMTTGMLTRIEAAA